MITLLKVEKKFLYGDGFKTLYESYLEKLIVVFSLGHAGVRGNKQADILAVAEVFDNNLTLDPPTIKQCLRQHLEAIRAPNTSHI